MTFDEKDGAAGSATDDDQDGVVGSTNTIDPNLELTRATTRFALDLRLLSALPAKGSKRELSPEEKDVRGALVACSTMCTTARNAAIRAHVRNDGQLFDDWLAANGGVMPRGKDVVYPPAYSYALVRKVAPLLASGIAATIGREVDRKWVSERRAVLHFQERSPPHYRVGQPFPIRAADARWVWDPTHGRAVVTVQLFSPGMGLQGRGDLQEDGVQGPESARDTAKDGAGQAKSRQARGKQEQKGVGQADGVKGVGRGVVHDGKAAGSPTTRIAKDGAAGPGEQARASRFKLPIEARDAHQREILTKLASGEWRAGEVRIERDRLRPAKWYLRISYKRMVPRRVVGPAAAVNRGMKCFIVAMIEGRDGRQGGPGASDAKDGRQGVTSPSTGQAQTAHGMGAQADPPKPIGYGETWVYDAHDIESYLKQMQKRRQQYQRGVKASNRIGHGRPRALRTIEHLAGVGERWRQTRCQVIARRLAMWLADRGVSRVYLDDFTGIRDSPPETLDAKDPKRQQWIWERIQEWPYYQLGMRLEACLAEYGIECIKQEVVGNSMHCPQCFYEDAANKDLRNWKLTCKNPARSSRGRVGCGYSRHLDIAFCANALLRSRGSATLRSAVNGSAELPEGGVGEKRTARKPPRK